VDEFPVALDEDVDGVRFGVPVRDADVRETRGGRPGGGRTARERPHPQRTQSGEESAAAHSLVHTRISGHGEISLRQTNSLSLIFSGAACRR
jgi:hypothetical protein